MALRADGVLLARSLHDHVVIHPVQITVRITHIESAWESRGMPEPPLNPGCFRQVPKKFAVTLSQ
jgi:hypothetical protein